MRRLSFLLLVLLLSGAALAGWNDGMYTDPNCVAIYTFEETPGGVVDTNDMRGNGNTLTASASAPTVDDVNYAEGAASALFTRTSSQNYTLADASLSSGFPLKNASTNLSFTVTMWVRPTIPVDVSYYYSLWSKSQAGWNLGTQAFLFGGDITFHLRGDNATNVGTNTTSDWYAAEGHWYHIAISYDKVSKLLIIVIWDKTADDYAISTISQVQASITVPYTEADAFCLGTVDETTGHRMYDGQMDEVTVWNRALTTDEIDDIRQGTYEGTPSAPTNSTIRHILYQDNRRRRP